MSLTGFRSRLVLTPTEDGHRWELEDPLIYQGARDTFTVPRAFETDLASVPRWFWWAFPPFGPWSAAAVLHDWLYSTHQVSRKDADGIFLRVMLASGTKLWRAAVAYRAVRIFGGSAWRRKAPEPPSPAE